VAVDNSPGRPIDVWITWSLSSRFNDVIDQTRDRFARYNGTMTLEEGAIWVANMLKLCHRKNHSCAYNRARVHTFTLSIRSLSMSTSLYSLQYLSMRLAGTAFLVRYLKNQYYAVCTVIVEVTVVYWITYSDLKKKKLTRPGTIKMVKLSPCTGAQLAQF
jgi:hypothetical protein